MIIHNQHTDYSVHTVNLESNCPEKKGSSNPLAALFCGASGFSFCLLTFTAHKTKNNPLKCLHTVAEIASRQSSLSYIPVFLFSFLPSFFSPVQVLFPWRQTVFVYPSCTSNIPGLLETTNNIQNIKFSTHVDLYLSALKRSLSDLQGENSKGGSVKL